LSCVGQPTPPLVFEQSLQNRKLRAGLRWQSPENKGAAL